MNKKVIGKINSLELLMPKKIEAEFISGLFHNFSGDIRKLINGIILARENVSKKPLIIIRQSKKQNCLFLIGLNTFHISINIWIVDISENFFFIF